MPKNLTLLFYITSVIVFTGCASKEKRMFMAHCAETSALEKACSCAYDTLESTYGEERFSQILSGKIAPPQDFTDNMARSVMQCS